MEEVKALFRVCAHIKSNGLRCLNPAMTGMNFCFQHIGGKPIAFVREKTTLTYKTNLNLAHPGTREAIQHNLALVAYALNEGKIDAQTANTYIRLYRVAEQNLHRWEKAHKNNPEAQMLPFFEEATEPEPTTQDVILSEAQPATHDVILSEAERSGAQSKDPLFSDAGATNNTNSTTNDVILSEAQPPTNNVILSEAERSGAKPKDPLFSDAGATNPASSIPYPDITPNHELSKEELARRSARFAEIDRKYSQSPDYVDRILTAYVELEAEMKARIASQQTAS